MKSEWNAWQTACLDQTNSSYPLGAHDPCGSQIIHDPFNHCIRSVEFVVTELSDFHSFVSIYIIYSQHVSGTEICVLFLSSYIRDT